MKKEKLTRRFFASKFFFLISLVVLGFLIFGLGGKVMDGYQIDKEVKMMEEEITRLEAKNSELNNFFNYLNTDAFVEEEARLKFNLQKPGESVMIISESDLKEENKGKIALAEREEIFKTNPVKWWNYFFNSQEQ